jgi:hypothetical protein
MIESGIMSEELEGIRGLTKKTVEGRTVIDWDCG